MRCGSRPRRRWSGCARRCTTAQHHRRPTSRRPSPTQFRVEGVPPAQDAAFRQAADRGRGELRSQLRRQRHLHLHDEAERAGDAARRGGRAGAADDRAARQRAGRHRAEHRAAGATAIRSWCSCPASPTSNRAKEIIGSTGLLELKIVEQGPSPTREALLVNGQVPAGMEIVPGASGAPGDAAARCYYLVRRAAAVTGRDLRNARPSLDENNRPAVSFTLNTEGGAQVRQRHRREHRPAARHHPRRPRAVGADASKGGSRPTAASPAASRRRRSQNLSLILRSGALPATLTYLEERTIGPSLGADSIRVGRDGVARRPAAGHRVHARSTTSCRA